MASGALVENPVCGFSKAWGARSRRPRRRQRPWAWSSWGGARERPRNQIRLSLPGPPLSSTVSASSRAIAMPTSTRPTPATASANSRMDLNPIRLSSLHSSCRDDARRRGSGRSHEAMETRRATGGPSSKPGRTNVSRRWAVRIPTQSDLHVPQSSPEETIRRNRVRDVCKKPNERPDPACESRSRGHVQQGDRDAPPACGE